MSFCPSNALALSSSEADYIVTEAFQFEVIDINTIPPLPDIRRTTLATAYKDSKFEGPCINRIYNL